jgi:hypothetical protein
MTRTRQQGFRTRRIADRPGVLSSQQGGPAKDERASERTGGEARTAATTPDCSGWTSLSTGVTCAYIPIPEETFTCTRRFENRLP